MEFDGTLEFDINKDLIQTKNPKNTFITRIKINPAKEQNFEYNPKPNEIIHFGIGLNFMPPGLMPHDYDSVVEEIRSLENVLKIEYVDFFFNFGHKETGLHFAKIIGTMLSMTYLKQIVLDLDVSFGELDIEEEFPKNWNVEKITFDLPFQSLSFKVWNKLPNIKQVKVVTYEYVRNLPVFLKHISVLKNLNPSICKLMDVMPMKNLMLKTLDIFLKSRIVAIS